MKVYYWKGKKNFGDLLTPLLVERFCHLSTEWVEAKDAELVVVGSIIEHLSTYWHGTVVGSGFLKEDSYNLSGVANVLALRGPLSRKKIFTHKRDIVLADPGLLADELVPNQDKIWDLGIVAHWSDKTLAANPIFRRYNPKIINVADDPIKVITEIAQCKKIVSSSLHGIILADAFGIPRRIEIPPLALSNPKQEGGLFKWLDYSASINMKLEVGKTQEPDRNIITEKQHELFDVFEEVKNLFS